MEVIDQIQTGFFSPENPSLFRPLVDSLLGYDEFMVIADYQSYIDCQERVGQTYLDSERWTKMSILNVARMGYFSSDRAIREYCQHIWKVAPVKIALGAEKQPRKPAARRKKTADIPTPEAGVPVSEVKRPLPEIAVAKPPIRDQRPEA